MAFSLRNFLTLLVFSATISTGQAQAVSPSDASTAITPPLPPLQRAASIKGEKYKAYLYSRYADDKLATAVIRLFARRQTGGTLWLSTGAVVIGAITSQTGSKTTSSGTTTLTITPLGYGLLLGLFGGVGIHKLARFSNESLYQALNAYDKDHSFPGYIMQRLDEKDYQ